MDAKPAAHESLKQKTAQDAKSEERRKAAAEKKAKAQAAKREMMFKRAEQYHEEYKQAERDLVKQRRVARLNGDFFREPEARLALVVPYPWYQPDLSSHSQDLASSSSPSDLQRRLCPS